MALSATLRDYLAAVESALRDYFGERVRQYGIQEPWNPDEEAAEPTLKTPALLIEVEGVAPDVVEDHEPGTITIRLNVAIHAILSSRSERLQVALPELAVGVIALIRQPDHPPPWPPISGNRWGLGEAVGLPDAVSAQPDGFSPGLPGHDGWVVRFEQLLRLPVYLPY